MSDLILAQQLLAACGGYVEAKAAAIELNNQADEIERLRAVVDAAAWYVNSLENGKTTEAMNLRLQALAKAIATLDTVGRQDTADGS